MRELDEYAGTVTADCRGAGAIYTVGRNRLGWFCNCPARGRCAHVEALSLVVALEPRESDCANL